MGKSRKKKRKIEGLGDAVAAVTETLGIDKVVKKTFDKMGLDCGCEERRKKWNKVLPFRRKPQNCLTENEYNKLTEIFEERGHTITAQMQKELRVISDRINNEKTEMSGCPNCIRGLYDRMKQIWITYRDEKDNQS